ncbi:MAG: large-conductance mechanosensitive channel protein MscL [Oscillospiraceae bacterium]|jgi:large conductance mechanosensitive channel|nr:large-conductance mechanosensitive channel protein MscL [Oscillospiraceae bacterium]MBQ1805157.1 large-conductance mechanosensitive channel protein MscL [Oscillospiraceae bacterium]MBQ2223487.1 large-conductance mechanosensitive channel protein MscL [Oscillospiraceae bacterium]MBQ5443299.1 large-conductance mechanosensitive channel protein MscL [Oscillospiraceae bacterium]MBQ5535351.1 large-conductance mechanosensitive channel protein MscL [Oscillospiraceae bacterium]
MKKLISEFKEFIMRGNVLDMAVGVIIATAFGKITTSLVNDVFMPLISWIFGARDMTALNVIVRPAELDASGEVVKEAITLGFGTFLATIIDFILVALVVFAIVKSFNKARELAKKKEEEAPAAPPEPSAEEKLLTEIRDLLKDQK